MGKPNKSTNTRLSACAPSKTDANPRLLGGTEQLSNSLNKPHHDDPQTDILPSEGFSSTLAAPANTVTFDPKIARTMVLRILQTNKEITLEDLAIQLEIKPITLRKLIDGTPISQQTLDRLSTALVTIYCRKYCTVTSNH